eukprot:jgi/Chrzof1/6429/Cz18g10110.t1
MDDTSTTILRLPESVLSSILLLCNKKVAAAAVWAHPCLCAAWRSHKYTWMAKQNASHCLVHLCNANDLLGVQNMLALGVRRKIMAKAFTESAKRGNGSILHLLLHYEANVNGVAMISTISKQCALRYAAENGHTSTVRLLLAAGTDVHACNDAALCSAAVRGRLSTVQVLLKSGADVHACDDEALCYAVKHGQTSTVQLLLESGADIHACDDAALCTAAAVGRLSIVQLLLQSGANVHACDDEALRCAVENGHTSIVQLLLQSGANVHACDDEALRYTTENGHTSIVQLLLESGADVHACRDEALRYAVEKGHTSTVQLLLESGADFHTCPDDDALTRAHCKSCCSMLMIGMRLLFTKCRTPAQ